MAQFAKSTVGSHLLDIFDNDEQLVQRMMDKFRQDRAWRDEWKDYDAIRSRYERVHKPHGQNDRGVDHRPGFVNKPQQHDETPYANLMIGLVGEFLSVLLPNIPDARLFSTKEVDPRLPKLEKVVRTELLREAEEAANLIVSSALFENDFDIQLTEAISESAVYGSGILRVDTDWAGDPVSDPRLRSFIQNWKDGKIGKEEAEAYFDTMGRICVERIPTDQVYWEAGRRRVDKFMRRCSIIEEVNTYALAQQYPEHAEKIMHVEGTEFIDLSTQGLGTQEFSDGSGQLDATQILTTWEYVDLEYDIEGRMITDRILVKTIIAGHNVLLDKQLITHDGDSVEWKGYEEEVDYWEDKAEGEGDGAYENDNGQSDGPWVFGSIRGAVRLPLIPIQVFQSLQHPYGRSMIEQMMVHEDVYNNIIAILMAYSNRGLENGKIFINKAAMASGESQRIQHGLKDPAVDIIEIEGSNPYGEEPDIRRMIMTHQNLVQQPPAMLINMAQLILGDFQRLAGLADQGAIGRARSGSGKRAQLAATDRPKLIPIENIAEAIESIWDVIYLNFQALYDNENMVPFMLASGVSGQITINQEVQEPLPVLNEFGEVIAHPDLADYDNPLGLLRVPRVFEINSNRIPMKAIADDRRHVSTDPITQTNKMALWQQLGWVSPQTARAEALPPRIRDRDDANQQISLFEQQRNQLSSMMGGMQEGGGMGGSPTDGQLRNSMGEPNTPAMGDSGGTSAKISLGG